MKQGSLSIASLVRLVGAIEQRLGRYTVVLFVLLLAGVYGFVLFRISVLSTAQPGDSDIATQVKASPTPHVDPTVVQQMQNLQDNSVSVQSLFNEARSNPFQE